MKFELGQKVMMKVARGPKREVTVIATGGGHTTFQIGPTFLCLTDEEAKRKIAG